MALNIRDLDRMFEFSLELQSLGTVHCLSLNADHPSQANKKLEASGSKSTGFVRWLFGEMARRHTEGCSDEDDPIEDHSFSAEELSSVTDKELEEFAEKLIQKNRYLLKTHKSRDIEKSVDESACDFLVRAFRHHTAEQKAQWERMIEPVSKSLFTSSTVETMQRNIGLSVQLQDTIDKYAFGYSGVEQFLAEEKERWARMNESVFQSLSANATMEAMQRNLVQQSALGSIAEANQYVTESSATAAMEKIMERDQGLLRAATSPFQDAQHFLDKCSASTMLAKAIYHNEDIFRAATCGLAQRECMSAVVAAELEKQQQETRDLLKSHEAMFSLPQASEATRLLASYQVGAVAEFAQQHAKDMLDRQRFLGAITTPWVNSVKSVRSVSAILELQGIGNALRTINGFDLGLTAALRLDLGDWRDKITFPESVFIDPVARTDFYITRGFNTALTDFPEAAFHQTLDVAGLDGETLDFDLNGHFVRPSADSKEESGLQRTNKCHDRLQRFERRLRQFIDDEMTAQYGSDWPKKQLAPKLYEDWEFKKQRAETNGNTLTFIEVADFTDYETIICKQDHWREIFETKFKKKESVRESLQRLQPIRLAAMHARIVTKEDELYLIAETVRLISAIHYRPAI